MSEIRRMAPAPPLELTRRPLEVLDAVWQFTTSVARWLWALAASLPETVVGVVVGSFFTLLGVVLTNRTNLKNLRLQHAHDRDARKADRFIEMRRDVYMAAAEAIAEGMNLVMRQADLALDQRTMDADWRAKSSSLAKVHIVATPETAIALSQFSRELATTIVRLSIRRTVLAAERARALRELDLMGAHNQRVADLQEQYRQGVLQGVLDERREQVLRHASEHEGAEAMARATAHDEINDALRVQHMRFTLQCQEESIRLSGMLLPVLVAIRTELGNPIDVTAYQHVFTKEPIIGADQLEEMFGVRTASQDDQV